MAVVGQGQSMAKVGVIQVSCANSNAIWHDSHKVFRCDCRRSRIKTHHPSKDSNKHAMDVHVAIELARSVVSMLACAPPVVARKLGSNDSSREANVSKEETWSKVEANDKREFAYSNAPRIPPGRLASLIDTRHIPMLVPTFHLFYFMFSRVIC